MTVPPPVAPPVRVITPPSDVPAVRSAGWWWRPAAGFEVRDGLHTPAEAGGAPEPLGPALVSAGGDSLAFAPGGEVLSAFRKLAFRKLREKPDPQEVVQFANRWGWLGHGGFAVPAGWDGGGALLPIAGLCAEPLSLWYWQARVIDDLARHVEAAHTLERCNDERARRYLADRALPLEADGAAYAPSDVLRFGEERATFPVLADDVMDNQKLARAAIHAASFVVEEQLTGAVSVSVLPAAKRGLYYHPVSLLSALYFEIALLISDQRRHRQKVCNWCGRAFLATRSHAQTCSARCRSAAYYRRHHPEGLSG